MLMNVYQFKAMETRLQSADLFYAALGLSGEVGEFNGYLAKLIRDGGRADLDHVAKELGDILWFVAALCQDYGISLEEVAQKNLEKLKSRKERGVLAGSGDNR